MNKTTTKFMVCLFVLFGMHTGIGYAAVITPARAHMERVRTGDDWMKSPSATWPGMKDGKTYWYKLDKKGGLWWSADGNQWASVKEGTWADSDGKWLKIYHKKLVWSSDGKSWSEVPEWKWKASDGKWYKFDQTWTLWVNG
jgi:hypothetical protein